ncbi:MAG TPA: class I SAM-dependent methyltransferase [Alphaproteobacteria bacterium]|nr:class I SAM-dependent methyltransferase [Alphaproteobacteria bacterium]
MADESETRAVERHYAARALEESVLEALRAAGRDPEALTPADVAVFDQFHVRGLTATRELAELAGIGAADRVLDVGSGTGGPSRFLAATYGCRVRGLDLTPEYCRVATLLARLTRLDERLDYTTGDALRLPFADHEFDVVWTQHAAMNIADRRRLYGEMRRVLRPGGRLAVHDVVAGRGALLHFPVPWARDPSISHLVTAAEMRELLAGAGFTPQSWRDDTEAARAWFAQSPRPGPTAAAPPLGLNVLMGPDFPKMVANLRRNLEEGRVTLVMAVLG